MPPVASEYGSLGVDAGVAETIDDGSKLIQLGFGLLQKVLDVLLLEFAG